MYFFGVLSICSIAFQSGAYQVIFNGQLYRNDKSKTIETLLFGNSETNILVNENSMIFNKFRAYTRQTKRF